MTKKHVLIVDDDWLNVEVIEAYLEAEQYSVGSSTSGEHALSYVQRRLPDLILLDVRMSGMTGYETCAALKSNARTAHIPILLVTAFQEDADIQQAIDAGADDILFKPIRSKLLLLRVKSLIRIKTLYDRVQQLS